MTASVIGSATIVTFDGNNPSGTVTIGAGATHLIALVDYIDLNASATLTGLSVGGTAMTQKLSAPSGGAGYAEVWYLGGSPTGSSLTVAATGFAAGNNKIIVTFLSVAGVSNPTTTNFTASPTGTPTLLTSAVTVAVGDLVIATAWSGRGGASMDAFTNGFTSTTETQSTSGWSRGEGAYKIAASTTETASVETNTNGAGAVLAVVVFPAAGGGSSAKLLTMISNQAGF